MIDIKKDENITILSINNPPMNVLNSELLKELDKALEEVKKSEALGLVVTGEGRAFVAGADIKEMMDMDSGEAKKFARRGQSVFRKLEKLSIPVIAAVNGFALGGGTELALACDVRIASSAAKFGQPEVALGVIPGFGGTQRLARLVGPGKAKELIFTGDIIGAQDALAIGLAQQLVDGYKMDENGEKVMNEKGRPIQDNTPVVDAGVAMAKKIAGKGPIAIASAKKVIRKGLDMSLKKGLELEAKEFSLLFDTKDQKEGMDAFVEKRKPEFKGD